MTDIKDVSLAHWVVANKMVNENSDLLEFKDRLFLFDIMQDRAKVQVIKKCAQVGVSVMMNLKSFFMAKSGLTVIYTMPSDSDVWEFAKTKTDKIIQANEVIRTGMLLDNATLKQFSNKRFIFFKGTISKTAPISTTADVRIHDEYDRSDMNIVDQYQSRLSTSKYAATIYLSNPSARRRGVDVYWLKSDKRNGS